eukprot:IDg6651t1
MLRNLILDDWCSAFGEMTASFRYSLLLRKEQSRKGVRFPHYDRERTIGAQSTANYSATDGDSHLRLHLLDSIAQKATGRAPVRQRFFCSLDISMFLHPTKCVVDRELVKRK